MCALDVSLCQIFIVDGVLPPGIGFELISPDNVCGTRQTAKIQG